jgi:hypothetical protein
MRIRVNSKGKIYLIQCPAGTRVVRCGVQFVPASAEPHDFLVLPFRGQRISITADAPELLPLLAESERFGLSLVGEPMPDLNQAGAVCPNCNEDVSWLSVNDQSRTAHCDYCGCDFRLGDQL